jgi:ATP-dependent DNA helicase DinG
VFPLVVLDIETTGLDAESDAIIELGVVRIAPDQTSTTWTSLINPGRLIPPEITALTNITNEMVRTAPPLKAILQDFIDFVGEVPVVGHNVRFDLAFIQRQGALKYNPVLDTRELASVLMPTLSRYNLSTLGDEFKAENSNPHRALDDALLTASVFQELLNLARKLPLELLTEIVQLARGLDWDGRFCFTEVLRERSKEPLVAKKSRPGDLALLFKNPQDLFAPALKPNPEMQLLNEDEVTALLEHGGAFEKYFNGGDGRPKFESRPQQQDMLRSVTAALNKSRHMMIEAGTGIGKSFAYLLPAALWSTANNQRVVISTNTINLQDQLMDKDIPDLRTALGLNLRAAVLKGRSNYLCPRRLEAMRHRGPQTIEELRVLAKVLVWLDAGGSGEKRQITLSGPYEQDVWVRLSAEDESCNTEVCQNRMGGACPYFQARQSAQGAHVIVVNHALLLADVITNSKVLPEYKYLIVDEAHHLESATTGALSYRVSSADVSRLFYELGGLGSGILGLLHKALATRVDPSELAGMSTAINHATDLIFQADNAFKKFIKTLEEFLEQEREGRPVGDYGQQMRITPSVQHLPGWTPVEIAWDDAHNLLDSLIKLLTRLQRDVTDSTQGEEETLAEIVGDLNSLLRRLEEMQLRITALVSEPGSEMINWVEIEPRAQRLSLNVAPLHIGTMMEKYLWHEKESVILTSATLTADGVFDYLRGRLNADEADELVLGSPFDYENSALLFLPNDMPEPVEYAQFQKWVERTLLQTAKATGGRMLALFTSYKQLKMTAAVIAPRLAEAGIRLYEQGEGASATSLLENFRSRDRAVLLGTRSFWEGVDIPGEKLSMLVIVKLPFDVPNDPIIAARAETFESPFDEYNLPEAILRFRQGFGRLIRTQSDRGVVAILDRRILTKKYGQMFLHSLPSCTQRIAPVEELPGEAKKWLGI